MLELIEIITIIGFIYNDKEYLYKAYKIKIVNNYVILSKYINSVDHSLIAFSPLDYSNTNLPKCILLLENYFPELKRRKKINYLLKL